MFPHKQNTGISTAVTKYESFDPLPLAQKDHPISFLVSGDLEFCPGSLPTVMSWFYPENFKSFGFVLKP